MGSPQGHDSADRLMPCFTAPCSMLVQQQAGFDKVGTLHRKKAAYISYETHLDGSLVLLLHCLHSVQALTHGQHEGQHLLLKGSYLRAVLLLQGGTESF